MIRSGTLVVVGDILACCLSVAMAGDAATEQPATAPPLIYHRVYAPAERMDEWPTSNERYLPIETRQFEQFIGRIEQRAAGVPSTAWVRIERATYRAKLVGDQLVEGRADLQIVHRAGQPSLLALQPCSLAISQPSWADGDSAAAQLGLTESAGLFAMVEQSGTLRFDWSLHGRRDPQGKLLFVVRLPASTSKRIELSMPPGAIPASDHGIVQPGPVTADGWQSWQIELGGRNVFSLGVTLQGEPAHSGPLTIVRQALVYELAPRGIDVSAQFTLDVHHGPLREFVLSTSPDLKVIEAKLGKLSIPWTVSNDEDAGTRVVLKLPEQVEGTGRILRVAAVAPLTSGRRTALPVIRPEDVFWESGTAQLLVRRPLELKQIDLDQCRQTQSEPLGGAREGDSIELEYASSSATAHLLVGVEAPSIVAHAAHSVRLSRDDWQCRTMADLRANGPDQFQLNGRILPGWHVDAVVAQPSQAIADWTVGANPAQPDRLRIQLSRPLGPNRPLRIIITGGRSSPERSHRFRTNDLRMVELDGVTSERAQMLLRPNDGLELSVEGDDVQVRLHPDTLEAAQRDRFDHLQDGYLMSLGQAARQLQFALVERRQGVEPATVPVEVPVAGAVAARPGVCAYRCELDAVVASDGTLTHTARYFLQNEGLRKASWQLPPGARFDAAWIDGRAVLVAQQPGKRQQGKLQLPLDTEKKLCTVVLQYVTAHTPLGVLATRSIQLPATDLPVLSGSWTLWLPPDYDTSLRLPTSPDRLPMSWSQRLFGPLGRPSRAARFNPLNARHWSSFFRSSPAVSDTPRIDHRAGRPFVNMARHDAPSSRGPWTMVETAQWHLPGWERYHFTDPLPAPLSVRVVRRSTIQATGLAAWLVFTALTYWRLGDFRAAWVMFAGLTAAAAWMLPETYVSIATGCFLGLLAGAALRLLRLVSRPATAGSEPADGASSVTRHAMVLITAGLASAISAPNALAAQPDTARDTPEIHATPNARSPIHSVFIPVDSKKKPVGDQVYISEAFFHELHRRAEAAQPSTSGWMLTAATYRSTLSRETVQSNIDVLPITAQLDLQVFSRKTKVRLPLGRSGIESLEARLNGMPLGFVWNADGSAITFEVDEPGEYRLTLTLKPLIRYTQGTSGFDVSIPPLATSRLEIELPENAPRITLPSAAGAIESDEQRRILRARLGAAGQLAAQWPTPTHSGAAGPAVEAQQLFWLRIRPGIVLLDAKFKLNVTEGHVQTMRLGIDPRLRLLPFADDSPVQNVRVVPGDPRQIEWQLDRAVGDQVTIDARLLLTGTSGVGNLRLPYLQLLGEHASRRLLAVSVDPALEGRIMQAEGLQPLPVPRFVTEWQDETESEPQLAYELPADRQADWSISTQPRETVTRADQMLALHVARGSIRVELDATIQVESGYRFQHRMTVPQSLVIDRISVSEQGMDRPIRWSRDGKGLVTVFLSRPLASRQQLTLSGRLPAPDSGQIALPEVRVHADRVGVDRVQVWRQEDVAVEMTQLVGLQRNGDPPGRPASAGQGRLAGSFLVTLRPAAGTLVLSPNQPRVSGVQVTTLRHDPQGWNAEVAFRFQVNGGLLDAVRLRVPESFSGPFLVDPAAESEAIRRPFDDQQVLRIEWPKPVTDSAALVIRSPLRAAAGQGLTVPKVQPLLAGNLERFVVLPDQAFGRRIAWKTEGLRVAQLPDGFRRPSAADQPHTVYAVVRDDRDDFLAVPRWQSQRPENPFIRLADVRIALRNDGRMHGAATFDLWPAGRSPWVLQMPAGYEILDARVSRQPARLQPLPAGRWQLVLDATDIPQQIEVLFLAPASEEHWRLAERPLPAPWIGTTRGPIPVQQIPVQQFPVQPIPVQPIPVQQTLWTVYAPPGTRLAGSGIGSPCGSNQQQLARLRSAASLLSYAGAFGAELDEKNMDRRYAAWAERLVAAHDDILQTAPQGGAGTLAVSQATEVMGEQRARVRALAEMNATLSPGEASSSGAAGPVGLWQWSVNPDATVHRFNLGGPVPSLDVRWRDTAPASPLWRIAGSVLLFALVAVAGGLASYGRWPLDWIRRWPHLAATLIGLSWWLWLAPSVLGWVILAVTGLSLLRLGLLQLGWLRSGLLQADSLRFISR